MRQLTFSDKCDELYQDYYDFEQSHRTELAQCIPEGWGQMEFLHVMEGVCMDCGEEETGKRLSEKSKEIFKANWIGVETRKKKLIDEMFKCIRPEPDDVLIRKRDGVVDRICWPTGLVAGFANELTVLGDIAVRDEAGILFSHVDESILKNNNLTVLTRQQHTLRFYIFAVTKPYRENHCREYFICKEREAAELFCKKGSGVVKPTTFIDRFAFNYIASAE